MDKPQIYAEAVPPPESGEEIAKVVLRGMVFEFETPRMDMRQAKTIAAEMNDRLEASDLNELIKKGQVDKVRDNVFRRAVRYAAAKASDRRRAGMGPLSTMAALTAGVGDMAVTASETVLASSNEEGHLEGELFEAACRGAAVVILECIILLHIWGIDARVVVRTFLDNMEGREDDAEDLGGAEAHYLRLVDKPEETN